MRTVPSNRTDPDQIFFVSASLIDRVPLFAENEAAQVVFDSLQFFRRNKEIALYGYMIMPDHVHLMVNPLAPLTLPKFMRRLKSYVAHSIGKGPIWQKGCWSEVIINSDMLWSRVRYLNENPVRSGLVSVSTDYVWSSAREYLWEEPPGLIDAIE